MPTSPIYKKYSNSFQNLTAFLITNGTVLEQNYISISSGLHLCLYVYNSSLVCSHAYEACLYYHPHNAFRHPGTKVLLWRVWIWITNLEYLCESSVLDCVLSRTVSTSDDVGLPAHLLLTLQILEISHISCCSISWRLFQSTTIKQTCL